MVHVGRDAGLDASRPLQAPHTYSGYLQETDCELSHMQNLVQQETQLSDYKLASGVDQNVLIYDCDMLSLDATSNPQLEAEWMRALKDGPGVIVVRGAFGQHSMIDAVTEAFEEIIASEAAGSRTLKGDHFAKSGANSRIWNSFEKLAVHKPDLWVQYYSNRVIATVSRAWLGPGYQLTSQVNVVHPGGHAQDMHCDYHLGFCTNAEAQRFPAHAHEMSQYLTLQGAVAHCEMPLESGPTLYLPYSQRYSHVYLCGRREEFKAYFTQQCSQLPLKKGDAVFFNPALLHAAGQNSSKDINRVANLLQISSPMGRAMETVDSNRICLAVYPALNQMVQQRSLGRVEQRNVLAAAAEGYAFPTNLDKDPPVDGLAPATQADTLRCAQKQRWDIERLKVAISDHAKRRLSS